MADGFCVSGLGIANGRESFHDLGDRDTCKSLKGGENAYELRFIEFDPPFTKVPEIHLSVLALDTDTNYNTRYVVKAIDVTKKGFTIKVSTWCDTYLYWIEVAYFAFGYVQPLLTV